MIYRFGVCTLDTQTHELHREGQIVPLQPKVFQVLTYLIEHRHRLVTKQELLEHVWQSQFVHDSVIARCIMAARKAIGDREGDPQSIITLRSQGYRFTADVIDHGEATPHAAIQEVQVASLSPLSPGQDSLDWFRVSPSPATLPAPEAWRLASSIHTVERKWVTVLCCTLVGITMHEGHTPAGQHNLLHAFLDLAIPEVRRYGGTLQSVMPEGFLVLFGAPIAYEDHAQRAILAALGLRRCLHAWYTRAGFSRMQEPTLRLGLHTGLMMVGRVVDDIPMSYAAGEIPDLAIQLASGAAPGTIVTSATTARLVRSIVRVVALSPDGAGPPPPLPSYQVCAVTPRHAVGERFGDGEAPAGARACEERTHAPTQSRQGPAGARACEERTHAPTQSRQLTRFVGRQRELATLHALLQLAKVGRGQVSSIVGEPGMGKSRLLYEFHRSLQQQRVTYLAGECVSYGRTIPYLPVLDVLQHHCGITADDADAVIIAKVQRSLQKVEMAPETWAPALLQLLGVQHKTAGGDLLNAPTMKRQIFEAFHQMVLNGSRQQPCIVVIEDLHWIDPTSKEYVEMLVDRLPGAAILLLTTFRPGYQPAWMGKSYATQIALQPLGAEESRQVVHSILHTTSAAHTLVPPILAKAEGNPLFLEELARHTMTHEAEPQQSIVPDTLQSLLAARIDRLSLAEKHMRARSQGSNPWQTQVVVLGVFRSSRIFLWT